MDKVRGGMEALSAMQLTADMEGIVHRIINNWHIHLPNCSSTASENLAVATATPSFFFLVSETIILREYTRDLLFGVLDAQSKTVLHSKEVLAIILQDTIAEYKGYSRKEIMDLVFRAKNPLLSQEDVWVSLHIDIEPQKTYRPGYPVEKRGIYYLARRLSSQLSLITDKTDYGELEKCYSIWICRDDIPKEDCYSISFYEVVNTKNIGTQKMIAKENYDLMTLVIIKLGNKEYNGKREDEGYRLLRFLNTVMYPHKVDFMETVSEYIDFSKNSDLWKETERMGGLGQSIRDECLAEGIEYGIEIFILDNLEEQIPGERIIEKLQRRYELTRETAETYFERFKVS